MSDVAAPRIEQGGSGEAPPQAQRVQLELLAYAGRLLLENCESTGETNRALKATGRALTHADCVVVASYSALYVALGAVGPLLMPLRELRFNMAIQARVHSILDNVRCGQLEPAAALAQVIQLEVDAQRHARWLVILMLGAAATSLAVLLGADAGGALIAGLSTAWGLAARLELGRRNFSLLTLPFAAALIGGLVGGVAIQLGWTRSPGLALIVPALMLVPGPHFINGLLDLIDNHLPMSIARLFLACSIVIAAALGTILGVELTRQGFPHAEPGDNADRLNVLLDMALAGIVTCGFAAAYNTMWPHLAMAAAGGMTGHGLRYLALEAGWGLDAATFLGAMGVGVVAACIARSTRTPVAIIAYAGAVTMMPGLQIFRALGGAFQMARWPDARNESHLAGTIGAALQACLVIGALGLGLIIAARTVQFLAGDRPAPRA